MHIYDNFNIFIAKIYLRCTLNIKFFCLNSNEKTDFCDVQYHFFFMFIIKKEKISVMFNIEFWER